VTDAVVRSGAAADVDAVIALEAACFPRDPWSAALLTSDLEGGSSFTDYLVVEDANGIHGHAVISVAGDDAELQRIAVAPDVRRRGTGRVLLAAARANAAGRGATRMLLEVREDNEPALALYRGDGFVEMARRRRYYRDGADAVVMERPLP